MRKWRVAGVSFEHMHMGDLLREAYHHPEAEIVGVCDPDPARMADAIAAFQIPPEQVFRDIDECLRTTRPDLVLLCPATARHADVVEAVARHRVDILLEKPFAASLADADRILAAVAKAGVRLAINWPLRWYPAHMTAKRLIDEGAIGEVIEVHFYDGNRGPLFHRADKVVVSEAEVRAAKPTSWWYSAAAGGGSLLDYLGYGATLGTWFFNGQAPIEVTSVVDQPPGLEVDEHSITICRYARGISKFETRWGAFTDPWITQPQPKCGFVIVGSEGTISSYDFEPTDRCADARSSRGSKHSRGHAATALPRAGRIRAPCESDRRQHRGTARSDAVPHRAAHRRYRRACCEGAPHARAIALNLPTRERPGALTAASPTGTSRTKQRRRRTCPRRRRIHARRISL